MMRRWKPWCVVAALALSVLTARGEPSPATTRAADAGEPSSPKIGMLWSTVVKQHAKPAERLADMARHSMILLSPDDLGLEWTKDRYADLAETFKPDTVADGIKTLDQLQKLNPQATVFIEIYFYEANAKAYSPDSPWWLRDKKGKKTQFWPGCFDMDLANADYVRHVAKRIGAVLKATDGRVGIFLDNLNPDESAKKGWNQLIDLVRTDWPKVRIMANAGWDSEGLEWIAPKINGFMYEDSVDHTEDKDTEKYYARINATDQLLLAARLSINERFGPRKDAARMEKELIRTLVYTDMHYLYSDSTQEHAHSWWNLWDVPLGHPTQPPAKPDGANVVKRTFSNGEVLWLAASAKKAIKVELSEKRLVFGTKAAMTKEVTLEPGSWMILLRKPQPATTRGASVGD